MFESNTGRPRPKVLFNAACQLLGRPTSGLSPLGKVGLFVLILLHYPFCFGLLTQHNITNNITMSTFTTPKKQLTWLITGCSSGLGLSLTRAVQANGHKVLATSRDPSRTPSLVAEVEGKGGKWLQLDVDDPHSARIIDDLYAAGGEEIDVLVNNAGAALHAPPPPPPPAEARAVMETLYFGPLRLIRVVVPRMRRRRFGVVANFSSGAALDARDSMGVYGAAKAALDGESLSLHRTEREEKKERCVFGGWLAKRDLSAPKQVRRGPSPRKSPPSTSAC